MPEPKPPTFFTGLRVPLTGLAWIVRNPQSWKWLLCPILLFLGLLSAAGVFVYDRTASIYTWSSQTIGFLPDAIEPLFAGIIAAIGAVLIALGALLACWYGVSILASPFLDRISELAERSSDTPPSDLDASFSWKRFLKDVRLGVSHSLIAALLFIVVYIPLLLLSFVPGVNLVATPLAFVWSAIFLAREIMDYSLSRRSLSFGEKIGVMRTFSGLTLGMGLMGAAFMAIPLVNLLVLPSLIVGGSLAVTQMIAQTKRPIPDAMIAARPLEGIEADLA